MKWHTADHRKNDIGNKLTIQTFIWKLNNKYLPFPRWKRCHQISTGYNITFFDYIIRIADVIRITSAKFVHGSWNEWQYHACFIIEYRMIYNFSQEFRRPQLFSTFRVKGHTCTIGCHVWCFSSKTDSLNCEAQSHYGSFADSCKDNYRWDGNLYVHAKCYKH